MKLADMKFESIDGVLVARVKGEIDMSNTDELGSAVTGRITNDSFGVVLDLSAVDYVDSAAIHLFFQLRERLRNRGQDMRLVVPEGSPVAGALRLANVHGEVGFAETTEDALEGMGSNL